MNAPLQRFAGGFWLISSALYGDGQYDKDGQKVAWFAQRPGGHRAAWPAGYKLDGPARLALYLKKARILLLWGDGAMTVKELYEQSIKPLPAADRFQLATMILGDIPREAVIDYHSEWSDEDLRDFSRASWKRIESDAGYDYDG